ncbi:MAG: arginine N-succinyltransferase [Bermanella sp.]|jgi:arginine N-succinyltransferase
MLYIRPVAMNDLNDLLELSIKAGKGMTSLPNDPEALGHKIQSSIDSFASSQPSDEDYFLLVMEDTNKQKVVGTAGVYARTGARQAFYAYRVISMNHHSHNLDKQVHNDLLHLTNDYTGCSEVGTLFLDPDYRGNGHWLAKSRYLLMAQFPERFAEHVIAELRGYVNEAGKSPFWDAIGQHFFEMDFDEADNLCGVGSNQFITELMPKHPIYTKLLPQEAQDVIGRPNIAGRRAMELLEEEGFEFDNVVDIFDAGPIMRGRINQLRSIRKMDQGLAAVSDERMLSSKTMIANSSLENFRVVYAQMIRTGSGLVKLSEESLNVLNVNPGTLLRYLPRV